MNTIQLKGNVSYETYQVIVDYIPSLGVEIKSPKTLNITPELTEEDFKNIAISREQAERGELIDSEEVHQILRSRYKD